MKKKILAFTLALALALTLAACGGGNGSGNGGGSVVNAFYKGEDGGWTLEQTYADANGIRRNIGNAGADAEN